MLLFFKSFAAALHQGPKEINHVGMSVCPAHLDKAHSGDPGASLAPCRVPHRRVKGSLPPRAHGTEVTTAAIYRAIYPRPRPGPRGHCKHYPVLSSQARQTHSTPPRTRYTRRQANTFTPENVVNKITAHEGKISVAAATQTHLGR